MVTVGSCGSPGQILQCHASGPVVPASASGFGCGWDTPLLVDRGPGETDGRAARFFERAVGTWSTANIIVETMYTVVLPSIPNRGPKQNLDILGDVDASYGWKQGLAEVGPGAIACEAIVDVSSCTFVGNGPCTASSRACATRALRAHAHEY